MKIVYVNKNSCVERKMSKKIDSEDIYNIDELV